jgi:hypothetical protein
MHRDFWKETVRKLVKSMDVQVESQARIECDGKASRCAEVSFTLLRVRRLSQKSKDNFYSEDAAKGMGRTVASAAKDNFYSEDAAKGMGRTVASAAGT